MKQARIKLWQLCVGFTVSLALLLGAAKQWLPYSVTETLGFITGVWCVVLVVRENIWNFPVGIANNLFFLALFLQARLFGDASLQLVYLVLGFHGWYAWLYGGAQRTELRVQRAVMKTLLVTGLVTGLATVALVIVLRRMGGAAPVLDALTTMLSLAAQYLLNRKLLENWLVWITADVLYVYLYLSRGLQLTAVLYAIFLGLCVLGWWRWRASLMAAKAELMLETAHG